MTSKNEWRASERLRFHWDWSLLEFCELLQDRVSLRDFAIDETQDIETAQSHTEDNAVVVQLSRPNGWGIPPFESLDILLAISHAAPSELDADWLNERFVPQFDDALAIIRRLTDD